MRHRWVIAPRGAVIFAAVCGLSLGQYLRLTLDPPRFTYPAPGTKEHLFSLEHSGLVVQYAAPIYTSGESTRVPILVSCPDSEGNPLLRETWREELRLYDPAQAHYIGLLKTEEGLKPVHALLDVERIEKEGRERCRG